MLGLPSVSCFGRPTPKLRSSFDNIFLCALWYGKGEISWDPIFDHYASEISRVENTKYNDRSYQIRFTTIFLDVDLVCKHDVLKMKKINGYYGCGLCTIRRFSGSHSYPNNCTFTMRNPAEHEHLVRLFESGVVNERKGRKEKDLEVDTLGVKGRSKIFDIVPNLPLTCPIDTMHQCLKGVAYGVIKFFAAQLSSTEKGEIDNATSEVSLPNEFKLSITSLRSLEHFKANELKTFLLYFSPLIFCKFSENSVAHETNIQNLDYLAFSLRSMYESVSNANICGHLLEAFCYNMSFRYPLKKFDSINFYLLRHIAWQCTTFGPLWTTSATMFENANNHLIRTLTGMVNYCSLIVSRYIRNRQLGSFETKEDNLTCFIEKLKNKPSEFKEDLCVEKNEIFNETQAEYPEAHLFGRFRGLFHLDSQSCTRSNANSFLAIREDGEFKVGQILLFVDRSSVIFCLVPLYEIIETVVIVLRSTEFEKESDVLEPLAYRVTKLPDIQLLRVDSVQNMLIKFFFLGDLFYQRAKTFQARLGLKDSLVLKI